MLRRCDATAAIRETRDAKVRFSGMNNAFAIRLWMETNVKLQCATVASSKAVASCSFCLCPKLFFGREVKEVDGEKKSKNKKEASSTSAGNAPGASYGPRGSRGGSLSLLSQNDKHAASGRHSRLMHAMLTDCIPGLILTACPIHLLHSPQRGCLPAILPQLPRPRSPDAALQGAPASSST